MHDRLLLFFRLAKELLQKVERISTVNGVDLSPVTSHHQSLEDRLTDLNRILRDLSGQIENTSATNTLLQVMLDSLKVDKCCWFLKVNKYCWFAEKTINLQRFCMQ